MNPYHPSTADHVHDEREQSTTKPESNDARNVQRWLAVVPIAISCACISAIGGFLYTELFSRAGDFTDMIALGRGAIAGVVGGVVGLVGGIIYAARKR